MSDTNTNPMLSNIPPRREQDNFRHTSNYYPKWKVLALQDTVLAKNSLFISGLSPHDYVLACSEHARDESESSSQTLIIVGKSALPIVVTTAINYMENNLQITQETLGLDLPSFLTNTYKALEIMSGLERLLYLWCAKSGSEKDKAIKELSEAIQYAETLDNMAFAEEASELERTDFLDRFNRTVEQSICDISKLLKHCNNSDFNWSIAS